MAHAVTHFRSLSQILRKAAEKTMELSHKQEMEPPWDRESPLTRLLLHDGGPNGKNRFHCLDIWHCVALGIGKSWIASGAMMLSKLIPESSNDKRFFVMNQRYKAFCREHKLDAYLRKVDIHTFGGPGTKERNGSWNKAAVTSNFMLFFEAFCEAETEKIRGNEALRIFVSGLNLCTMVFISGVQITCTFLETHATLCVFTWCPEAFGTRQMNIFFRGMYKKDGLMSSAEGKELGTALLNFVQAYFWEASDSYRRGVSAFPLYPKLHACHEIAFELLHQAKSGPWCLNPALHACATDEDFIGRMAALSRCVSPMLIPQRTIERYLCHIHLLWARAWVSKEKRKRRRGMWSPQVLYHDHIAYMLAFSYMQLVGASKWP